MKFICIILVILMIFNECCSLVGARTDTTIKAGSSAAKAAAGAAKAGKDAAVNSAQAGVKAVKDAIKGIN